MQTRIHVKTTISSVDVPKNPQEGCCNLLCNSLSFFDKLPHKMARIGEYFECSEKYYFCIKVHFTLYLIGKCTRDYKGLLSRSNELATTLIDEKAIAALATIGLSKTPHPG